MGDAKPTPGPWTAGNTHFQRDFRTFVNVTGGKDHFVACVSADPMHRDAIAANARLIAAAPELLAVLKLFPGFTDDATVGDVWIEAVRAALDRAEGK